MFGSTVAHTKKSNVIIDRSHDDDATAMMILLFCVRYSLISHKYCPIIGLSFVSWVFVSTCVCVSKSFFMNWEKSANTSTFKYLRFLFKIFKGITKSKAKFQLLIVYIHGMQIHDNFYVEFCFILFVSTVNSECMSRLETVQIRRIWRNKFGSLFVFEIQNQ